MHVATNARQPLLARLLRRYLQSSLRGRTRLTALATRHLSSLWSVPIRIQDHPPLYVDLRSPYAQHLLAGDPWSAAPREQAEQDVMRRVVRPGDTAIDIGANLGLHTVLLSRLIGPEGQLYVFEPNPALLPPLRRTVSGLSNATLHACALSDRTGRSAFFIPADDTKASLADWTDMAIDGKAREATCEQRRLDDLLVDRTITSPDFIKCDVEGAELLVFRGARGILDRRNAPVVLFEVNAHTAKGFGLAADAAKLFLEGLPSPRYHFFEIREDGALLPIVTLNPWCNVLAIPESRLDA